MCPNNFKYRTNNNLKKNEAQLNSEKKINENIRQNQIH